MIFHVLHRRYWYPLEFALPSQYLNNYNLIWLQFIMAIKMDHVIKVTRSSSLRKGAYLFSKDFLKWIAKYPDTFFRLIRIGMVHVTENRVKDNYFVISQIQFDTW